MRNWFALVALLLPVVATPVQAQSGPAAPLLMQRPTVSKTHIVFSYADDLWIVPRDGGEAKRLTTGPGVETDPMFSPDGKWVAFTGQYDGNDDVFIISAEGGDAKRLTYHPGSDQVVGWTPDGKKVLFRSSRDSYSRFTRLFTIGTEGALPDAVPLPIADLGCYSPDGKKMAYVPFYNGSRSIGFNVAWKHYRGGRQPVVWIADLSDSSIEKLPRTDSNDTSPMWIKDQIYFLSDRDGPNTLFVYDPSAKAAKKIIPNGRKEYDIRSASAGPDCIVYEKPGEIHLFDLATQKSKDVPITIKSELPTLRPRWVKVQNMISGVGLSPTGARAVFEARGEIFTVPASKGEIRNITRSPAVFDRYPTWSPDGKSIAYFSDESGEYEICIRPQDGKGEIKKIKPGDAPSFYYQPVWSPDSKKLAYTDKRLNLWVTDVESGKSTKIDTNPTSGGRIGGQAWSPDSKWLGYTKELKSSMYAVFLHNLETSKSSQLTDGMADVGTVAFDKGGKYLYFTASTDAGPARGSLMSTIGRSSSSNVYLVVLNPDDPSPLAPESDEEKGEVDRGAEMKKKFGEAGKAAPVTVKIDLTDIDQRILSLPVGSGRFAAIVPGKAGTVFLVEMPEMRGGGGPGAGPGLSVTRFDLSTRRGERVLDGVSGFTVSANSDKMMYRQGTRWTIASTAGTPAALPAALAGAGAGRGGPGRGRGAPAPTPAPAEAGSGVLNLENMEVKIDPRAEWRQIYNEVWRVQRDFMYDPGYHGLNIKDTAKKYEKFLPAVASRTDLSYLFEEMLGDLALGHLRTGGGDRQTVSGPSNGLLGADYKIENDRYRIARIYRGENWNPQLRSPLTQPGLRVKEGEYILAIDDEELKGSDNIHRMLEAKSGKLVVLKVSANPDGKDAREVKVTPIASEQQLRHYAWVTDNRAKVDKATDGKVAYIYMPDTSTGGQTRFNREFYAQVGKEGVILDERFNGGGWLADSIIEALSRKVLNFSSSREGDDVVFPRGIFGPKAMIINESAGSGGDYMPYIFRQQKVGPLIGKKTWGGLVGVGGYPTLIDGGNITAPHWAIWFADEGKDQGKWGVENIGVSPDIEVELDPKLWRQGRDTQLEKAIEVVREELKKNPVKLPKRPTYPNYHTEKSGQK